MKIPTDSIVVEGQDIECTETELTGEPDAMEKVILNMDNYKKDGSTTTMLAKSLCTQGFGKALVLAVGTNTVAGIITESTQKPPEPTLLQKKLHTIADKIGKVGMWVALMTMIAQLIRIALEMLKVVPCGCQNILECQELPGCEPLTFGFSNFKLYNQLLYTVIISITVIVVAIPEGLPLAVTISLSVSSKQMQKLNNLVRKLASSETMGGATHICSDKTGTLTMNKMTTMACNTLQGVYMAGKVVRMGLANDVKTGSQGVMIDGESVWKTLTEGVLWNSSARLEKNDGTDDSETGEFVTKGNVTEQGLIKFFMWALGAQGTIDEKKRLLEENTLCTVSFTSARKRASIVVRRPEFEGTNKEVRVYCKGAPDMVFEDTTHVVCADGSVQGINEEGTCPMELIQQGEHKDTDLVSYQAQFDRTIKKFAAEAYRTLLITYKDMSMDEYNQLKSDNNDFAKEADRQCLEKNLVAVGIFGLQDPLRDGISQSIAKCRTAGITTIMCTGDNIDTAIAISKNAGIVTEEECKRSQYSCMTGKDFRETVGGLVKMEDPNDNKKTISCVKDQRKFIEVIKHLKVLARSSPEDKLILVTGIQEQKGVVAVTGDGTNDAPALTQADVGFAMGITGTDVAKGACDIILLDDNFTSIVVALKFGRNVYDNVRKFLQFQLTVNVVAMFIVFFGSTILRETPLTAVQMLWVNLIMDTFAALALATEAPYDSILERQPYHKDAAIVTEIMWRNVFGHSIYQSIVITMIIFLGQGTLSEHYYVPCLKFDTEANTDGNIECLSYNPYYATNHYATSKDIKWWQEQTVAGDNLKAKDFDPKLLTKYACELYRETQAKEDDNQFKANVNKFNHDKKTKFECGGETEVVDEFLAAAEVDKENYTPLAQPTGYDTQKLLHFTFVFQAFVFMQIFNQFNARKLEMEMNVFGGIFRNPLFLQITVLTVIIQMLMVEFGGKIVKSKPLNTNENIFCIVIGALELVVGVVVKFFPLKWFQCVRLDEKPSTGEGGVLAAMRPSANPRKQQ